MVPVFLLWAPWISRSWADTNLFGDLFWGLLAKHLAVPTTQASVLWVTYISRLHVFTRVDGKKTHGKKWTVLESKNWGFMNWYDQNRSSTGSLAISFQLVKHVGLQSCRGNKVKFGFRWLQSSRWLWLDHCIPNNWSMMKRCNFGQPTQKCCSCSSPFQNTWCHHSIRERRGGRVHCTTHVHLNSAPHESFHFLWILKRKAAILTGWQSNSLVGKKSLTLNILNTFVNPVLDHFHGLHHMSQNAKVRHIGLEGLKAHLGHRHESPGIRFLKGNTLDIGLHMPWDDILCVQGRIYRVRPPTHGDLEWTEKGIYKSFTHVHTYIYYYIDGFITTHAYIYI